MHENDQDELDKLISDLYSESSQESPSSAADEKILSQSRAELKDDSAHSDKKDSVANFRSKGSSPFSGQWTVPASLAAVIVLSVTVVFMIERDRPYSLTSPPEESISIERPPEVEQPEVEQLAKETDASSGRSLQRAISEKPSGNSSSSQRQISEKEKQEAAKALHQLQQGEIMALQQQVRKPESVKQAKPEPEAKTGAASSQEAAPEEDSLSRKKLAVVAPREKESEVEADSESGTAVTAAAPEPVTARKAQGPVVRSAPVVENLAKDEAVRSVPETTVADEVSSQEESPASQPAKQSGETVPQESTLSELDIDEVSNDAEDSAASEPEQQLAGSAGAAQSPPVSASESPALEPSASFKTFSATVSKQSMQDNCSTLAIVDCLASRQCALESAEEGQYQCRRVDNYCEENFSQADDSREVCESRQGCKYRPASCFCPPGQQDCDCSGGAPAMCIPEE